MSRSKRSRLAGASSLPRLADAESYPSRPVHIIVPVPPGGTFDIVGRLIAEWLSKRLGHRLIAPDLGSVGFQLMGGRLLSADSGPAALFMYEDGKGTRLSCYYLPVEGRRETAFQYREQNGVGAFYWVDDGLAYAIAANAPRDLLLRVAELIYKQNSPDGAKAKLPPAPGKPS